MVKGLSHDAHGRHDPCADLVRFGGHARLFARRQIRFADQSGAGLRRTAPEA